MNKIYPWQQNLWQEISNYSNYGHAYLFYGAQGLGKLQLVQTFAAYLLCENKAQYACGICKNCKLLAANTHPDLFLLKSLEPNKEISVEQVRGLIGFLAQTSHQGGYKVVIIEQAEMLNRNSANALLKSLEEPSGKSILLLLTNQINRLLPTITSRCLKIACPKPDLTQAADFLTKNLAHLNNEQIQILLFLAQGSPLLAQDLAQNEVLEQRQKWQLGVKQLLKAQISVVALAANLQSLPLLMQFDWACDLVMRIFRYQISNDESGLGLADTAQVIKYLAGKTHFSQVLAVQEWLMDMRHKVLSRANLNPQLLLESMFLKLLSLR